MDLTDKKQRISLLPSTWKMIDSNVEDTQNSLKSEIKLEINKNSEAVQSDIQAQTQSCSLSEGFEKNITTSKEGKDSCCSINSDVKRERDQQNPELNSFGYTSTAIQHEVEDQIEKDIDDVNDMESNVTTIIKTHESDERS